MDGPSKILIAVVTCQKHGAKADMLRKGWVSEVKGADCRFFLARQDRERLPDEVFLDCPDGYESLCYKTREMSRWALRQGYTNVFKVDDDVDVFPDRLMAAVPDRDYVGFLNNMPPRPWCSGFAYWLTQRAISIVAESEIPEGETAEDRFVGGVLFDAGIKPFFDKRFCYFKPPIWLI